MKIMLYICGMKKNKVKKGKIDGLTFKILVGVPLSGKSTYREKMLIENPDIVVISNDDIMLELCEDPSDYNKCYSEISGKQIKKEFNIIKDKAIKERKSIIIDTTNCKSTRRRKLLANVPDKYTKIAVYFEYEYSQLLERNDTRMEENNKNISQKLLDDFIDGFQPINKQEEGFDKIVTIKK